MAETRYREGKTKWQRERDRQVRRQTDWGKAGWKNVFFFQRMLDGFLTASQSIGQVSSSVQMFGVQTQASAAVHVEAKKRKEIRFQVSAMIYCLLCYSYSVDTKCQRMLLYSSKIWHHRSQLAPVNLSNCSHFVDVYWFWSENQSGLVITWFA